MSEAGWTRVVVKSTFGVARDFRVTDAAGTDVAVVDGKFGLRPRAEIRNAAGTILAHVVGTLFGIPKRLTVTAPDGAEIASLRAKFFSPIRSRITITLADGRQWDLTGNIIEKDYTITSAGQPVAQITQKWVTVRDSYTVDVRDARDLTLALAVVWGVDAFREQK